MEHGSSPTNYPGRTPIQIVGRLLFSVMILAAGRPRTSNLIFKESGSSPTSPPRRTYSSLASVSAETPFYWACHFPFSLARKFPFLEIENPIAETQGAEDEMLPSPFGGILAAGRRVALPGARLERGIKPRINRAVPMGLIRGTSQGLGLPRPFPGQITQAR